MEFTSYQIVADNTASLNTASYLNRTEHSLFVKGYTSDLWYGFSANDIVEFGAWDRQNNFVGWNVLNQSKSYNITTLSYLNTLDSVVTYSYAELKPDFILFKNEKILVNPPEQLSESINAQSGSYFFTYNFAREMAGNQNDPLIIKDISPSRKEVKLIPLASDSPMYNAFCNKKVIVQDVSPLYLKSTAKCPYEQIYNKISPLYTKEINVVKSIFFLATDGAMLTFLRNLYEDLIIYTTVPKSQGSIEVITGSLVRIQGIQTYFSNYLLSNSTTIVDFTELDRQFNGYVSASIERKFSPIGAHPLQPYVEAKAFVYDFFTKYYYQPISNLLSTTYKEKYFSYFRNALNFGDNLLLPILQHGMLDERVAPTDPLTLIVKLKDELPGNIAVQEKCWVSNVSLNPYVLNAIVKSPQDGIIHQIGPPNFSLPIPNVSLTNTNMVYTADDLAVEEQVDRDLTVSRNLTELSVDYTNFSNFVVFSSAELRLNIFKNKVRSLTSYSSSLQTLDAKNTAFLATSGSSYPFYTEEYNTLQGQMTEIVNSFDGYESYLYQSGVYTFVSGAFISASYVANMDISASAYDKNNLDSLINNCPQHILTNSDNDDYVIFLSMIGHFFDQIYEYISNIPSERSIGHGATEEFTRRVVDYMLETFGWQLDDSLEQANLLNNYLTSEQIDGLNEMSAEDRLKAIRNRLLINLPQIYKTKGTEESIRLILACYGIPSTLLTMREYGGISYTDDRASYTTYERSYLYMFDTSSQYNTIYSNYPEDAKTFLFKLCLDDASIYNYDQEIAIMGAISSSVSANEPSGSGAWAVGFVRRERPNVGQMWFRIGLRDNPQLKLYSETFPLFDGDIYSIMVRRNLSPDGFEFDENTDAVPCVFDLYVQKNERGERALRLTSSAISYDYDANQKFSSIGVGHHLVRGGWFTYHNGQGFHGVFDKLQVWYDPLTDSNFEDYVNSINSYAFSGSRPFHESLLFRQHTDYPFDLRQNPIGVADPLVGASSQPWGIWKNANPFYEVSSSAKITKYLGTTGVDMGYGMVWYPWSGSQKLVYDSGSGCMVSESCYPFQFKVVDYPSTWAVSKYGPNKFRNEKVRHVSQSIEARFDDKERSTWVNPISVAPDSNQIGFFADPQDFKNKDIIRYFGNYDFMDAIGDPTNQYSASYQSLKTFRKQYATSLNESSGSNTLFNELMILYKMYFNRSIFEAIKNVVPARSNAIVGVLIEPTVLERPKYIHKEIASEMNSGSVFYADITASHYFQDPNTKLLRLSMSLEDSQSTYLDLSYINFPTRDLPVNYGGNYIGDMADAYQMGTFGGGFLIGDPEVVQPPPIVPIANFIPVPSTGLAPLLVQFQNTSLNAGNYLWDFGDGETSIDENPSHTFDTPNDYTVTLTAYRGEEFDTYSEIILVTVPSIPCGAGAKFSGGAAMPTIMTLDLGNDTGLVTFRYDTYQAPDKFVVEIDGVEVLNTGYRGNAATYQSTLNTLLPQLGFPAESIVGIGQGTTTFNKTSTSRYATVKVYGPIGTTAWNFTSSCPGQPLPS